MNKNRTYLILEEPHIYRAFLHLAAPVIVANVMKSLHDIVDGYFIGHIENSSAAQAGISVTWPLLNLILSFGTGLAVAGVAIISQYLGADNYDKAREYSGALLSLSVIIGLAANLLLYFLSPPILQLMGAEGAVYDSGLIYLRVRSFEMVFLFIFGAFQSVRQARGDTVTPVIFTLISIAVNIILTAVFVRIYNMNVFGAALATMISQAVVSPFMVFMMFQKKDELAVTRTDLIPNRSCLKQLIKMALPSAGSQAFSSLGFLILQAVILSYGDTVAAAFSNGNKISNLLLIPIMAFGSVLAAFIGQNVGAGNKARAKESYRVSRNCALLVSTAGALIIYPFREFALSILTNNSETLSIGMEYMFWVLLTQPLMSLFQNYLGLFNGSGNTKYSFAIASARLWLIRLPIIVVFKNFTELGRSGIWYAMVISNLIIIVIASLLSRKIDFEKKVS